MSVQNDLESFLDLMSQERGALRDARFDRLEDIQTRKEAIVMALRTQIITPSARARMRQELLRNQALMSATSEGVMAARTLLERLASGPAHLTYRADGACETLAERKGKMQRRA